MIGMSAPNVGEPIRNDSVTIGATSTLLSNARERKEIYCTNTGATILSISFGKAAVAGQGIVLGPTGFWFASVSTGYIPPQQDIYIISSAAGGTLGIMER